MGAPVTVDWVKVAQHAETSLARAAAPLVRIDPRALVRNDPPLSGVVFGDRGRRREEETSLLEVSALV